MMYLGSSEADSIIVQYPLVRQIWSILIQMHTIALKPCPSLLYVVAVQILMISRDDFLISMMLNYLTTLLFHSILQFCCPHFHYFPLPLTLLEHYHQVGNLLNWNYGQKHQSSDYWTHTPGYNRSMTN